MFMLMPFVLLYVCIKIYTSALSGKAAAAAATAEPSMSISLFALRVLCCVHLCGVVGDDGGGREQSPL